MEKNNNYPYLGKNIRALRKAFGKSQYDMSMDLNMCDTTISQYENGIQIPERDKLLQIAKYFKVTENELIYGDFSHLKNFNLSLVDNEKCFEYMFPVICSDDALKNKNFKKAYDIHMQIYENLKNGKDFDEEPDFTFLELYKEAYNEGRIEGIANILCWTMLEGLLINIDTPYFNDMVEIYPELSSKQVLEIVHLNIPDEEYNERNKKYEKERLEYIKDTEDEFFRNIAILKKDTRYAELADYYISFRYMLGLYNNALSFELNRAIGYELLNTLDKLGNKYAKK